MLLDGFTAASNTDASYDIAGYTLSAPATNDIIMRFVANRAFKLPTNIAGSVFNTGTNPSSAATLTLKKNGVSFGTVSISTGGVATPTVTATSFAVSDLLTIEVTTPNSIDKLAWTFKSVGV